MPWCSARFEHAKCAMLSIVYSRFSTSRILHAYFQKWAYILSALSPKNPSLIFLSINRKTPFFIRWSYLTWILSPKYFLVKREPKNPHVCYCWNPNSKFKIAPPHLKCTIFLRKTPSAKQEALYPPLIFGPHKRRTKVFYKTLFAYNVTNEIVKQGWDGCGRSVCRDGCGGCVSQARVIKVVEIWDYMDVGWTMG